MRYPHDAHRKELEAANELLEQERLLANEIIDGEMDDEE
jgi:26S proteasome regulatory subunit N3